VDQRVHRNDVVKLTQAPIEHVPNTVIHKPITNAADGALACQSNQCGRKIDRDHMRPAPGRFQRQRAGATTRVEKPLAMQIRG
jgi:hypothetical protein